MNLGLGDLDLDLGVTPQHFFFFSTRFLVFFLLSLGRRITRHARQTQFTVVRRGDGRFESSHNAAYTLNGGGGGGGSAAAAAAARRRRTGAAFGGGAVGGSGPIYPGYCPVGDR